MHSDLYFRSKVKLHIWSLEAIETRCPEGKFWPNWPYFDTYVRETDVRFEISASNYPRNHRNSKKTSVTSSEVIDLEWPRLTSGRSRGQCKPWLPLGNNYRYAYHRRKHWTSQATGFKTLRNANSTWHDLENDVTGQRSLGVGSPNFQKRCQIDDW